LSPPCVCNCILRDLLAKWFLNSIYPWSINNIFPTSPFPRVSPSDIPPLLKRSETSRGTFFFFPPCPIISPPSSFYYPLCVPFFKRSAASVTPFYAPTEVSPSSRFFPLPPPCTVQCTSLSPPPVRSSHPPSFSWVASNLFVFFPFTFRPTPPSPLIQQPVFSPPFADTSQGMPQLLDLRLSMSLATSFAMGLWKQ